MNKELLHQAIIKVLMDVHEAAHQATQMAIHTATDKENVPEHKYDTLSLEAAYLAHGQAQRVQQCLLDIHTFKALPIKSLSCQGFIQLGALVEVYDVQFGGNKWFFITPVAGGMNVVFDDKDIQLITLDSPLGSTLKNKREGDECELQIAEHQKCYEVIRIL